MPKPKKINRGPTMTNIVAPIKRHHTRPVIMCGACKNTGVEHKWTATADYVPTGKTCPACDGTGAAQKKQ